MPRIAFACFIGFVGFVAYVVAVVSLADRVHGQHWAVQGLYFAVAGVLWVIPARWLMLWAARKLPA